MQHFSHNDCHPTKKVIMKKRLLQAVYMFFAGLLLWGCSKNTTGTNEGTYMKIKKIISNGVDNTAFEYQNGVLKNIKDFSFCPEIPGMEEEYYYNGNVLSDLKIKTNLSSSTNCANAQIHSSSKTFIYDALNRIIKIIHGTSSYSVYVYEGNKNWVTKQIRYNTATGLPYDSTVFIRDNVGNIIETIEKTGRTFYKYDNKVNPFYVINKSPWFISVWNNSPNNVIEETNTSGTVKRTIMAYENNLPVKVLETNGIEYTYIY